MQPAIPPTLLELEAVRRILKNNIQKAELSSFDVEPVELKTSKSALFYIEQLIAEISSNYSSIRVGSRSRLWKGKPSIAARLNRYT